MESGKLTQARKPFDFHKSVQVVALSHRGQADATHVEFSMVLDPRIDSLGLLVGDEMRLRQMLSNIVSNALKFTRVGSVTVVTRLLAPSDDEGIPVTDEGAPSDGTFGTGTTAVSDKDRDDVELGLNEKRSSLVPPSSGSRRSREKRFAIVRVEVHDSGPGLRPADLVDNRLFSPYVQTEIGRRQGGKGSGLGLALVMQLIKISGGRLGVDSKLGVGSTFWFELQYPLLDAPHTEPTSPSLFGGYDRPSSTPKRRWGSTGSDVVHERRTSAPEPRRSLQRARLSSLPEMISASTTSESDAEHSRARSRAGSSTSASTYASVQVWDQQWALDSTCPPPHNGSEAPNGTVAAEFAPITTVISPTSTAPPPAPGGSPPRPPPQPLAAPVPLAPRTPPRTPPPRRQRQRLGDGLSVLVVDDDTLTRRLMTRMLQRLGADVSNAENGQSALDAIATNDFDVVFLDNQMPLMSGVEAVRVLRARGSQLFVVGCTGNALEEDQHEYRSAGADAILPKPVHQQDMEAKLVEARERKRVRESAPSSPGSGDTATPGRQGGPGDTHGGGRAAEA
jgi:CheY-like chemotaxis protein